MTVREGGRVLTGNGGGEEGMYRVARIGHTFSSDRLIGFKISLVSK